MIPIGGDGTFLLASKLITDNTKPVFGINTILPPTISCFTLPSKYAVDTESIFEKLHSGEYTLLMRSRIRTVMHGEGLYRRPFHIHEKSRTKGERRAEWVHYREVILSDLSLFSPVGNQYAHFYSRSRYSTAVRKYIHARLFLPFFPSFFLNIRSASVSIVLPTSARPRGQIFFHSNSNNYKEDLKRLASGFRRRIQNIRNSPTEIVIQRSILNSSPNGKIGCIQDLLSFECKRVLG